MKKDNELRKKMADIFADMEAEPQAESWENIQNSLKKPKKQKWFLWFWILFLSGSILGTSSYLVFYKNKKEKKVNTQQLAARKLPKPYEKTGEEMCEQSSGSNKPTSELVLQKEKHEKTTPKNRVSTIIPKDIPHKKDISAAPLSPIIRFEEQKALKNVFISDSSQNLQIFDNKQFNSKKLEQSDSLFVISPLQTRSYLLLTNSQIQLFSNDTISQIVSISPHKKGFLSTEVSLLSTFQLMQMQQNQLHSVGDVALLSTFHPKRLGISTALYYHRKLTPQNGIFAGINGFLLPYNMEYELQENHVYKVKFMQNGTYAISKQAEWYQERHFLYNLGIELGYERYFYGKNKSFALFLSGIANKTFAQNGLNYWLRSGAKVPINANWGLSPAFQLQLNRNLDEHKLMKTRLYTLGMGVHYVWK